MSRWLRRSRQLHADEGSEVRSVVRWGSQVMKKELKVRWHLVDKWGIAAEGKLKCGYTKDMETNCNTSNHKTFLIITTYKYFLFIYILDILPWPKIMFTTLQKFKQSTETISKYI